MLPNLFNIDFKYEHLSIKLIVNDANLLNLLRNNTEVKNQALQSLVKNTSLP